MSPFVWRLLAVALFIGCSHGASINSDVTDDNFQQMPELRRSKRNYKRGQTQSQYLNFGQPELDGKAEAEATETGSRSTVSGTHGMGQAQSQFSSGDCSGCAVGSPVYEYATGSPDPLTLGGTGAVPGRGVQLGGGGSSGVYTPGSAPGGSSAGETGRAGVSGGYAPGRTSGPGTGGTYGAGTPYTPGSADGKPTSVPGTSGTYAPGTTYTPGIGDAGRPDRPGTGGAYVPGTVYSPGTGIGARQPGTPGTSGTYVPGRAYTPGTVDATHTAVPGTVGAFGPATVYTPSAGGGRQTGGAYSPGVAYTPVTTDTRQTVIPGTSGGYAPGTTYAPGIGDAARTGRPLSGGGYVPGSVYTPGTVGTIQPGAPEAGGAYAPGTAYTPGTVDASQPGTPGTGGAYAPGSGYTPGTVHASQPGTPGTGGAYAPGSGYTPGTVHATQPGTPGTGSSFVPAGPYTPGTVVAGQAGRPGTSVNYAPAEAPGIYVPTPGSGGPGQVAAPGTGKSAIGGQGRPLLIAPPAALPRSVQGQQPGGGFHLKVPAYGQGAGQKITPTYGTIGQQGPTYGQPAVTTQIAGQPIGQPVSNYVPSVSLAAGQQQVPQYGTAPQPVSYPQQPGYARGYLPGGTVQPGIQYAPAGPVQILQKPAVDVTGGGVGFQAGQPRFDSSGVGYQPRIGSQPGSGAVAGQSGYGQSGYGQSGYGQSGYGQPGLIQPNFEQAGSTNFAPPGGGYPSGVLQPGTSYGQGVALQPGTSIGGGYAGGATYGQPSSVPQNGIPQPIAGGQPVLQQPGQPNIGGGYVPGTGQQTGTHTGFAQYPQRGIEPQPSVSGPEGRNVQGSNYGNGYGGVYGQQPGVYPGSVNGQPSPGIQHGPPGYETQTPGLQRAPLPGAGFPVGYENPAGGGIRQFGPGPQQQGIAGAGGTVAGADDAFSQAESSIGNGQASASSQGKKNGGTAKTQVQGTYTSSGSFSASAMTSDNDRSASSQVTGGAEGAMSQSQGQGGAAQSQAQVQINEKSGGTTASSQSSGIIHQSQSEVQASDKGGLADAQSSGPGQTSSQAQIGFRPGQDGEIVRSTGGGQASAQSGIHSGNSQSQIHGTSKYGVSYHGAAQSASGTKEQVATYREQNKDLFTKISRFGNSDAVTDRVDSLYSTALASESDIPDLQLKASRTNKEVSNSNKLDDDSISPDEDEEEEPYDEYEDEEDYYNENPIKMESKGDDDKNVPPSSPYRTHTQTSPNQTQQIAVADTNKQYNAIQNQNGRVQTYSHRTTTEIVPSGFRGTVNVEKKFHTKSLENHKSDNQLNVTAKEKFKHTPRTPDTFVTVTKSITGSMDNSKNPPQDNKNFQSTYYTKSSTCGYFTFSCNIVYGANGRSKICRPKAPTNGKC